MLGVCENMFNWFVRILFGVMLFVSGDINWVIIMILWEIWDELIKIRKELRK